MSIPEKLSERAARAGNPSWSEAFRAEEDRSWPRPILGIYCTLDGFASYNEHGDWGGYWGKEGPEFLAHRTEVLGPQQRLVLGANTFRQFMALIPGAVEDLDPVNARMKSMPTTVISETLQDPFDWPDATLVHADARAYVAKLKQSSTVPLRSHGSLSMNRALMAIGLVDTLR